MIVEVTNVTDGPGRTPTQVDIYNKTLDPGATVKLPAELVDSKVRKLEERGLICIGQVPPWYASAKMRKGKSLTPEQMKKRIAQPAVAAVVKTEPEPKAMPKVEHKKLFLEETTFEESPVVEELDRKRQKR